MRVPHKYSDPDKQERYADMLREQGQKLYEVIMELHESYDGEVVKDLCQIREDLRRSVVRREKRAEELREKRAEGPEGAKQGI